MAIEHTAEVTSLPPKATETKVLDFFASCGRIEHIDIIRAGECASKAYVTFEDASALENTVSHTGETLLGQPVYITQWRESSEESEHWNRASSWIGEDINTSYRRCVIAEKLSLLTSSDDMNYAFGDFGLEDVYFIPCDDGKFSRKCIVKFKTTDVVDMLLNEEYAALAMSKDFKKIPVTRCCPWRSPSWKNEKGEYKIECEGFAGKAKKYFSDCSTEEELIKRFEFLMEDMDYTGFQLLKDPKGVLEGKVQIRFLSNQQKMETTKLLRDMKLTVNAIKTKQLEEEKVAKKRKPEDDDLKKL